MNERMTLNEFLKQTRSERTRWESALARVAREKMETPGMPGGWSPKDLINHITWFEREMIGMLEARSMAGSSPWWLLETDERNRLIYEEARAYPINAVLEEAGQVYPRMMRVISSLSDDDLNDPSHFAEMPADWLPWQILADNTYEHYRVHAEELETWLALPGTR